MVELLETQTLGWRHAAAKTNCQQSVGHQAFAHVASGLHRQGTTDPQELDPALKGVSALKFPVTLVAVSKGRGFAVYRQEKATKDGGVTHPACTMYERAISYPLDLYLASDGLPDYLLGAELHGDAVPLTNYRIYPLGLART